MSSRDMYDERVKFLPAKDCWDKFSIFITGIEKLMPYITMIVIVWIAGYYVSKLSINSSCCGESQEISHERK